MRVQGQHILPKVLYTLKNIVLASLAGEGGTSTGIYRALRTFDELQILSDKQLRQSVAYAIDKKYIRIIKQGEKARITLTSEGRILVGAWAIEQLRPKTPKVWDKQWRVVMFDIPEEHKTGRDGFAANLKRLGFVTLQKSVFIFPHPCFEEVEVLAQYHGVGAHLTCLRADKIVSAQTVKELRKRFGLSV